MRGMASAEDIRKEIKRLEQEIEHKLGAYSNLSERIEQEAEEGTEEIAFSHHELNDELNALLKKVQNLLKNLKNFRTISKYARIFFNVYYSF
jgi:archaellum component FlaC